MLPLGGGENGENSKNKNKRNRELLDLSFLDQVTLNSFTTWLHIWYHCLHWGYPKRMSISKIRSAHLAPLPLNWGENFFLLPVLLTSATETLQKNNNRKFCSSVTCLQFHLPILLDSLSFERLLKHQTANRYDDVIYQQKTH